KAELGSRRIEQSQCDQVVDPENRLRPLRRSEKRVRRRLPAGIFGAPAARTLDRRAKSLGLADKSPLTLDNARCGGGRASQAKTCQTPRDKKRRGSGRSTCVIDANVVTVRLGASDHHQRLAVLACKFDKRRVRRTGQDDG